jgi:hypothetical protein
LLLMSSANPVLAADEPLRQSRDDAWWTGPIIANSAVTLPQGHYLIEPYLYDVISDDAESLGSLTFMLYGATDALTVGVVPVFGYNKGVDGARSAGPDVSTACASTRKAVGCPPFPCSCSTLSRLADTTSLIPAVPMVSEAVHTAPCCSSIARPISGCRTAAFCACA